MAAARINITANFVSPCSAKIAAAAPHARLSEVMNEGIALNIFIGIFFKLFFIHKSFFAVFYFFLPRQHFKFLRKKYKNT
jgi:hypothetical protein